MWNIKHCLISGSQHYLFGDQQMLKIMSCGLIELVLRACTWLLRTCIGLFGWHVLVVSKHLFVLFISFCWLKEVAFYYFHVPLLMALYA